jgi:DNA-directed RNA polymerase subunit M/transcription elongation factor TFIIS
MNRLIDIKIEGVTDKNFMRQWIKHQIKTDMKKYKNKIDFLNNLDINKYGWNHDFFQLEKRKEKEQEEYMFSNLQIENSLIKCNKCNTNNVYTITKQIRSSDESTSVLCFCMKCKKKWVY